MNGIAGIDRTRQSEQPDRWAFLKLIACGVLIGTPWLYPPLAVLKILGLIAWFRMAAVPNRSALRVFGDGAVIGFVSLGIAFHWARESIAETTHSTGALAYVVWGGLVLWEAIPFGMLSLVLSRTAGRWTMFGVPFVWGLLEIYWPRIFPWSVAHVFLEWLPLVQIAQLGGQALVTLVVLWFVVGTVFLWQRLEAELDHAKDPNADFDVEDLSTAEGRRRIRRHSPGAIALVTALPAIAALACGVWLLDASRSADEQARAIEVAALQVDPSYVGAVDRLAEFSDSLPEQTDLVLWPESTLGFFADSLHSFADTDAVLDLARHPCDAADPWPGIRCDLLAGAKTFQQDPDEGPYRNVAYLIDRQKEILDRYIKRDLMPIGEYVPGEQWFPVLRDWAALDDVLDRGDAPVALRLTSGPTVGVMICYEDMVAENAIDSVRAGAQVLTALINASQFSSPYTLLQHERLARFRAVETQRWVLRCGATGRTCLIAPTGKVVDSVPLQTEDVLVGRLKVRDGLTFYARYPQWFPAVCGLVTLGLVVAGRRSRGSDGTRSDS